ncbi:MAG: hypothetical protein CM1200mP12_11090 [Gammaproteobacteria bacterium]|nr:MAG: hypothetical protein CM1200mP12_11090 [Gammaproteobacteria bacterium]
MKIKGLNKEVSRVVFGWITIGSDHAFAMFDHYFSLGGNTFDTAYIYNKVRGCLLGKVDESSWFKGSSGSVGKKGHIPDCYPHLIDPARRSLDRLKTDHLDLYCLHRDNLEVPVSEFIDALNELKEEGLISLMGASNWSLSRFSESSTYAEASGKDAFSLLSNNFSLARMLEPVWPGCESCSEDDFTDFLKEKQIAIFPWSSQARGFFLEQQKFLKGVYTLQILIKKEQDRVWLSPDNLERRKRCFSLAEEKSIEPIELAFAFVLNQDFPSFPLIGPRNFFETKSSLKALEVKLSKDERDWLDLKD